MRTRYSFNRADPSDWTIAAANCDVLGFDWYAMELRSGILPGLLAQVDKPTLIGEFSFPPTYDLVRGFGVYAAANAADERGGGQAYQRWVSTSAPEPTTVGTMWFPHRDEPVSGRRPCPAGEADAPVCGEHYAFGAADETDRPKYQRMRRANLMRGSAEAAIDRFVGADGARPDVPRSDTGEHFAEAALAKADGP